MERPEGNGSRPAFPVSARSGGQAGALHTWCDPRRDRRPQAGVADVRRIRLVYLDDEQRLTLYVPERFAHGYQTLKDDTEVAYQMSAVYAPEFAGGSALRRPGARPRLAPSRHACLRAGPGFAGAGDRPRGARAPDGSSRLATGRPRRTSSQPRPSSGRLPPRGPCREARAEAPGRPAAVEVHRPSPRRLQARVGVRPPRTHLVEAAAACDDDRHASTIASPAGIPNPSTNDGTATNAAPWYRRSRSSSVTGRGRRRRPPRRGLR